MFTRTLRGYSWPVLEESDMALFVGDFANDPELKAAFMELIRKNTADCAHVPKEVMAESNFRTWFAENFVPAIESKYNCTIEEAFKYSAYDDLDHMIRFEHEYREFHGNEEPVTMSALMELAKLGIGYGIENMVKDRQFKKTESLLEVKRAKIIAAGNTPCSRCDGTGEWARKPGYTCFKCGGIGYVTNQHRRVIA